MPHGATFSKEDVDHVKRSQDDYKHVGPSPQSDYQTPYLHGEISIPLAEGGLNLDDVY